MTEREQFEDLCEQLALDKTDDNLYILFCAAHDRGSRAGKKEGYENGYWRGSNDAEEYMKESPWS